MERTEDGVRAKWVIPVGETGRVELSCYGDDAAIAFAANMVDRSLAAAGIALGGTEDGRERFGRIVRETWVNFCRATGDTKPSHVAPWDDLSEWDREVDMRIAESVLAAAGIALGETGTEQHRAALTFAADELDRLLNDDASMIRPGWRERIPRYADAVRALRELAELLGSVGAMEGEG